MRLRGLFVLCIALLGLAFMPTKSYADIGVSLSFDLFAPPLVAVAPPPLPVYIVPAPPVEGVIWTPGHWRWGGYGYFWVPGTWVQPPIAGVLWTPGYWGWRSGVFAWNEGYWAPHVGFYGGINYGGGYGGSGFVGGGWNHGVYNVNRSVTNVTNITNVTNNNTTNNYTTNNNTTSNTSSASFNGGPGGVTATPSAKEQSFAREAHTPMTEEQMTHARQASQNPGLAASANHGKPSIAATSRAGDFSHGVVAARQAGERNIAAEQHNASVRQNPALAKGGAMPANQQHPQQAQQRPPGQPHQGGGQPHAMQEPHNSGQVHEPDAHPNNEPAHEEGEPHREQGEHGPGDEGGHRSE